MRKVTQLKTTLAEELLKKVDGDQRKILEMVWDTLVSPGWEQLLARWELAAMQLETQIQTSPKMNQRDYWRLRGGLEMMESLFSLKEATRFQLESLETDTPTGSADTGNPLEEH